MQRLTALLIAGSLLTASTLNMSYADERRDNANMIRLVRPIAEKSKGSVVQVVSGDRPVALGTVVAEDGYVLTKRSELSGDPIRVRLHDGR